MAYSTYEGVERAFRAESRRALATLIAPLGDFQLGVDDAGGPAQGP